MSNRAAFRSMLQQLITVAKKLRLTFLVLLIRFMNIGSGMNRHFVRSSKMLVVSWTDHKISDVIFMGLAGALISKKLERGLHCMFIQ